MTAQLPSMEWVPGTALLLGSAVAWLWLRRRRSNTDS